jgi:phenylalanine-4-hydroxylase
VNCIEQTYDITEPQPQLFVTPDFKTLSRVLEEMAAKMAYRVGGLKGLNKAIEAESVNSAQLDSGLQISGKIVEAITTGDQQVAYLRFDGPSQLCFNDKQVPGHGKDYHAHGFGTPVGYFKQFPKTSPADLSDSQWKELGVEDGKTASLEYTSGVRVSGKVLKRTTQNGKSIVLALADAKAELNGRVLFAPEWGTFDMALGCQVVSVFGGPADRIAYGETSDFVAKRVPAPKYSEKELLRHADYGSVRKLRETKTAGADLEKALEKVLNTHNSAFPEDWLLSLESLELLKARAANSSLIPSLEEKLKTLAKKDKNTEAVIRDGLILAGQL